MSIYQHFRPEEREFIDQVQQWKDYVQRNYSEKLTDFLDPREQEIVKSIIGQQADIGWAFDGGTGGAERKRALIYPDYFQPEARDFQIKLFEIHYPSKFISIEHRQVLGSLMSLGLKRGKFGDILINGDQVQFFAASEVADYINMQLESVGRASISLKELDLKEAVQIDESWLETSLTVSSLRLDTIVSAFFNISRQKSQTIIQQGLTKVNWTVIESTSFDCREGDTISVRGFGRAKIISIEGKTKKEKWRILGGKQK